MGVNSFHIISQWDQLSISNVFKYKSIFKKAAGITIRSIDVG